MLRFFSVLLLACAALGIAVPRPARARDIAGVTLPETVSEGGKTLHLNGAALRIRAMFFKVYVIGLYLERPTQSAEAVIGADSVRRVDLHLLRALTGEEIGGAIREAFERNSADSLPRLRDRLDRLTRLFPAVQVGDVIVLAYVPGTGTRVSANGKELGVIEGNDFAAALFAVWLGPHPVDENLKRELLAGEAR